MVLQGEAVQALIKEANRQGRSRSSASDPLSKLRVDCANRPFRDCASHLVPEPQWLGSPFLIKTPRHLGLLNKRLWRLLWWYPVPKKPELQLQQPLSKLQLEEDLSVALALTL
ncbi:uncharacterized protein PITG_15941 [Phytophthora infestans T30-4]|uniref:Uncharacterized protein n=1 Tax=Phytophthora infestans (strain T30-4) TaxID=403677 RepID=D0NS32_PHYIT|nr:uncharacterized protein PITG_15941 [Phytophthora infestans T30-4]EEY63573.1 hypothetical protein PITG_15941 [Phytophthora infestans T30-4]|eukprot:XP_002898160.1 hypothetical protein PITG_15941 [Phytophthora infestans T30-4]